MKIDINNFGPIKKFSYDLSKDFVVTYGNNNIGKSYSMQIVYLLLKIIIDYCSNNPRHVMLNYYQMSFSGLGELPVEKCSKIVANFVGEKEDNKDITEDILNLFFEMLSNAIMQPFLNSCNNTFGNFEKALEQNPTIDVYTGKYNICIKLNERKIQGSVDMLPIKLKKTNTDFHKSRKCKNHIDVYVFKKSIDKPAELLADTIFNLLIDFMTLVSSKFENVYFLPASRSGIYSGMNAFGSIVAELSKNRAYLTKKIELPGISEPISDYFIFLSNIKPRINERYLDYYSK